MPVRGSHVAYGGLTSATGQAIVAAAAPWAERHRSERVGGWRMLVEIIRSEAETQSGVMTVEIEFVAQAKAAQAKAENQALTPLSVMMRGYQELEALGGRKDTHHTGRLLPRAQFPVPAVARDEGRIK
jgi:hypothetical protein